MMLKTDKLSNISDQIKTVGQNKHADKFLIVNRDEHENVNRFGTWILSQRNRNYNQHHCKKKYLYPQD